MASRTVLLIQSRFNSTRLPGKALEMIGPHTLLEHCYRRAAQAQLVDDVVVATGESLTNQPIVELCQQHGFRYFRGSDDDVLSRFYHAARDHKSDLIVRISGDSPLIDGEEIDHLIRVQQSRGYRYVSNAHPPTLPDGLDTEVVTFLTLCHLHKVATLASDREHVTPWLSRNLEPYRWCNVTHWPDLSRWRLCVDTPEDLKAMRAIMKHVGPDCTWRDAVAVLETHPDIAAINQRETRNEGYQRSLAKEQAYAQSSTGG